MSLWVSQNTSSFRSFPCGLYRVLWKICIFTVDFLFIVILVAYCWTLVFAFATTLFAHVIMMIRHHDYSFTVFWTSTTDTVDWIRHGMTLDGSPQCIGQLHLTESSMQSPWAVTMRMTQFACRLAFLVIGVWTLSDKTGWPPSPSSPAPDLSALFRSGIREVASKLRSFRRVPLHRRIKRFFNITT